MNRFDEEARRRLATGWDPRVCTAREYARQIGVSERALRLWRQRLRREEPHPVPGGNATVPLLATVDTLMTRLEDLDAAVEALHGALVAVREVLDAAAPEPVPGGTDVQADVQDVAQAEHVPAVPPRIDPIAIPTVAAQRVRSAKRGSFFSEFQ